MQFKVLYKIINFPFTPC